MRRLCSDPEIYDFNFGNSAKKQEFVRIVKDNLNGTTKILVFSQFKDCINLYSKALEKVGIKTLVITGDTPQNRRLELIEGFAKSKDVKVLLATDAFSYGQNLQMCSILINIDQHFNPAIIKQRIGRIQRIGQKEKVLNVINFLVENSIEEWIYEKIMRKNILFDTIITQNEKKFSFTDMVQEYLYDKEEADVEQANTQET
jgi:SNF2 family DNA or RNA helicase